MVVLYSTGCPRCSVLKMKLDQKKIAYQIFSDQDAMIQMGFKSAPLLQVDNEILDFTKAIAWVNQQEAAE